MSVRVRGIFAGLAAVFTAFFVGSPEITAAGGEARTISIYNIHTKETVTVLYKKDGGYVASALRRVNHAMRDWRLNEETDIDPLLVDILWEMHAELGSKEPIHLISGYRSRKTNDGLRESSGGQAKNSRHILGKAADIHFPDVPVKRMRYSALVRERGGVGYYPTSAIPFVHVDTDRVRHWPPMPRYELALLFPNGQTKHVPSDGQPITKEDVRVAQSKHKDLAIQIAEFFDVRQKPDANRTVLASLSGPYPVTTPKVAAPRQVAGPQLASLTGGPVTAPPGGLVRKEQAQGERMAMPAVAAAPPPAAKPAAPVAAPAAAGKPNDPLGALMARELAGLDAADAKAAKQPRALTAPLALAAAPAQKPVPAPMRVASADANSAVAAPPPDKFAGDTPKGWPTGFASAPAFDEEHPEELSYRPFSIGPILTAHQGHDHPVLAGMHHPDTGRVFDMLDEPDRLFPLSFRPGMQVAELMWAGQFNGAKVGADTLMGRLKTAAKGPLIQRQVATTAQR